MKHKSYTNGGATIEEISEDDSHDNDSIKEPEVVAEFEQEEEDPFKDVHF